MVRKTLLLLSALFLSTLAKPYPSTDCLAQGANQLIAMSQNVSQGPETFSVYAIDRQSGTATRQALITLPGFVPNFSRPVQAADGRRFFLYVSYPGPYVNLVELSASANLVNISPIVAGGWLQESFDLGAAYLLNNRFLMYLLIKRSANNHSVQLELLDLFTYRSTTLASSMPRNLYIREANFDITGTKLLMLTEDRSFSWTHFLMADLSAPQALQTIMRIPFQTPHLNVQQLGGLANVGFMLLYYQGRYRIGVVGDFFDPLLGINEYMNNHAYSPDASMPFDSRTNLMLYAFPQSYALPIQLVEGDLLNGGALRTTDTTLLSGQERILWLSS